MPEKKALLFVNPVSSVGDTSLAFSVPNSFMIHNSALLLSFYNFGSTPSRHSQGKDLPRSAFSGNKEGRLFLDAGMFFDLAGGVGYRRGYSPPTSSKMGLNDSGASGDVKA